MAEITLVRQQPTEIPEADRLAARNVLFGIVDGLGETSRKQWRRFVNRLMKLEPGEIVEIRTHQERIGWYHRKHMALEQRVFEAQEKFEDFEQFRVWLKVGSGFVDWLPGPKGGVIPVPRSISYAKLEQVDMEKVHADIVAFLRTDHAARTLWKHLSDTQRIEQVEFLLAQFGE
jgi:hypothetical protein